MGQSKMDNPEKLATYRVHKTQKNKTEEKHNTICVGHQYTQTNKSINICGLLIFEVNKKPRKAIPIKRSLQGINLDWKTQILNQPKTVFLFFNLKFNYPV